jgi:hypothetical protein
VSDNLQYSKLYKCNSVTKLTKLLETTEEFLQEFDYQEFSNILLGKHYNIYPIKKDNGSIRYIEEPTIYRYYFEDYTITKDNQPTTIKKGEIQKYGNGKWESLSFNQEEYSLLYQQSETKKTARKMGLRGKFFNRAKYVEVGLKEVQRVICEHLQFSILDFNKIRKNEAIVKDCLNLDYDYIIDKIGNKIDYLSLDIEGLGFRFEALKKVFESKRQFKVITIEHDSYRGQEFVEKEAIPQRSFLKEKGFVLVCEDVCNSKNPFEDWWINPKYITEYEKFICKKTSWNNIISKI